MNVFVVTIESGSDVKLLGMYANEKLAKTAMKEFVDTQAEGEKSFKKKIAKKEAVKKLMFEYTPAKDSEEETVSVFMMSDAVQGMKVTGGKAKKDPLAPKKNLSAFMLYANENRDKLKEANPDASFGDLGKKLGEAWRGLTDKQKEKYTKKATDDKARYEKEMTAYTVAE